MKKLILSVILLITFVLPAKSFYAPAEITQVHDMQMINQQRFRMEQLNDFNDVKQEKERYQKKNPSFEQPKPNINTYIVAPQSQFVDDGGQIKIKYYGR